MENAGKLSLEAAASRVGVATATTITSTSKSNNYEVFFLLSSVEGENHFCRRWMEEECYSFLFSASCNEKRMIHVAHTTVRNLVSSTSLNL